MFALDRLVTELSRHAADNGTRFVTPRVPVPGCALCGLTMSCESGDGFPLYPSAPPPYEASSSEPGEGEELLGRLLLRSIVPPVGMPGWVLWRTQTSCGHLLHDHCSVKLFGARTDVNDSPHCPTCGVPCTHESPNWWYGLSGTISELGFEACGPVDDDGDGGARMAVLDPRSHEALKAWLPESLLHSLLNTVAPPPPPYFADLVSGSSEPESTSHMG